MRSLYWAVFIRHLQIIITNHKLPSNKVLKLLCLNKAILVNKLIYQI